MLLLGEGEESSDVTTPGAAGGRSTESSMSAGSPMKQLIQRAAIGLSTSDGSVEDGIMALMRLPESMVASLQAYPMPRLSLPNPTVAAGPLTPSSLPWSRCGAAVGLLAGQLQDLAGSGHSSHSRETEAEGGEGSAADSADIPMMLPFLPLLLIPGNTGGPASAVALRAGERADPGALEDERDKSGIIPAPELDAGGTSATTVALQLNRLVHDAVLRLPDDTART